MTLPQFQQQAREKFDEKYGSYCEGEFYEKEDTNLGDEMRSDLDQLLADFLLEIEKEVVSVEDVEHYRGERAQIEQRAWNECRQYTLEAFKRLREVTK